MSRASGRSPAVARLAVFAIFTALCVVLGSANRVHTQNANDGEVRILPVRGNVYMLVGAGANITVQAADEGVLMVDTGVASMSDKVLAAVRTISSGPLRYLVNTSAGEDHTGGKAAIAPTGGAMDMSLSLRMTISRFLWAPALFMAS